MDPVMAAESERQLCTASRGPDYPSSPHFALKGSDRCLHHTSPAALRAFRGEPAAGPPAETVG